MTLLAVDSGTTSTRVWVMERGDVLTEVSGHAGARDLARSRDREWLAQRVRELSDEALRASGHEWRSVEAVVAFGMITSELGLMEVPHLDAPVDPGELAAGMQPGDLEKYLPAPVHFVPGVRFDADDLHTADLMRGEETEVAGLLGSGQVAPPFLFVSSGSHTKFIAVDDARRILWCLTTLSGELLWALHRETILAGLVDPKNDIEDFGAVEEGAGLCEEMGLTRALFAARLLNRVQGADPRSCSAFIHGAVAQEDLTALRLALERRGFALPTVVALRSGGALGQAYRRLLQKEDWVAELRDPPEPLGAMGAWWLYALRQRSRVV